MAKGINIVKYRGLKVRRGHGAVLHLNQLDPEVEKGKIRKIHLRFEWNDWIEFMKDLSEPIKDWKNE
jgi:hypothetical protein